MDSLDKYYEPAQLDVVYDRQTTPSYKHIDTPTPSSEELDQELEDLLLAMGGGATAPQTPQVPQQITTRLNEVKGIAPRQARKLTYQVPAVRSTQISHSNVCNSSKTDRFNYSPNNRNNCNYQAGHNSSKFNYQSDNSRQFSYAPTTNNDRFDYKVPSKDFNYQSNRSNQFDYTPTEPTRFDRPSNPKNYSTLPHAQNNSGSFSDGGGVLDVEVDQNTRVRLEVGASVSVENGSARAAAYAKATIYRRG